MRKILLPLLIVHIFIACAHCSPKSSEFGKIVDFATLQEWLNDTSPQTIVVDLRRSEEVASGMVPGARHIPIANLEARAQELPRDARIVLYCASGNRVYNALPILKGMGFTEVYNFVSISNWKGPLDYPQSEESH
jgi:rhodanese-related sulfurtransferase